MLVYTSYNSFIKPGKDILIKILVILCVHIFFYLDAPTKKKLMLW